MRRPRDRGAARARARGRARTTRRPRSARECGNLLARIPGRSERSVLLCAHLDTVPHERRRSSRCSSTAAGRARGDTILGADNKAAVAMLLELARRAALEGSPVGIELLFTVCEERALAGAKAFDAGRLRSALRLRLRPRHADRRDRRRRRRPTCAGRPSSTAAPRTPGSGRRTGAARSRRRARRSPRCRHGRIDAETTANVARIEGGVGRRPTSCPSAARVARRGALARRRARRGASSPRSSTAFHDAANDPAASATSTSSSSGSSRATGCKPRDPAVAAAEAGAARLRLRAERRSSPAAGRTPTRFDAGGLRRASTSPTAPSATTSRPSASAWRRSRGCST